MTKDLTDQARFSLILADQFARERRYPAVGPEHVLLAVLRRPEGGVRVVLRSLAVLEQFASDFERRIPNGPAQGIGKLPHSFLETKEMLGHAVGEALRLGHPKCGTEHLLLGIMSVKNNIAAKELSRAGVTLEIVREHVSRLVPPSPLTGSEYLDETTAEQRLQALSENQRRLKEQRCVNDLHQRLNNWHQARMIREFIDATKETAAAKQLMIPEGCELDEWLKWAAIKADNLDPIYQMLSSLASRDKPD